MMSAHSTLFILTDVHVVSTQQGGVHGNVHPEWVLVGRRIGTSHVDDGITVSEGNA